MIQITLIVTNVLHDIKGNKAIREYSYSTLPAMWSKQGTQRYATAAGDVKAKVAVVVPRRTIVLV